ncbi:MAG: DUF4157 domain-containing protein [Terracidiphilus sp.]
MWRRRKLLLGSTTDPLESEADSLADRVMSSSGAERSDSINTSQALHRKRQIPPIAEISGAQDALYSPSHPLDAATRAFMEPRIGRDLGGVRVHTDDSVAGWARDIDANAFTAGNHIFFDKDCYAPHSRQGRRLLAHELAHVVQQAEGRGVGTIQRSPKKPGEETPPERILDAPYKLQVDHAMNPEEVLHEFIKQYFKLTSEADIAKVRTSWKVEPDVSVTAADVAAGYKYLRLKQTSKGYFARLSKEEQQKVNTEADKRFWDTTGYKRGKKLTGSAEDREMAKEWTKARESVLLEDSQKKQIDALPKDIRGVLFGGDAGAKPASPEEYAQILQLASKLMQLTPAQRADYLARVNAETNSWADMDASIDQYVQVMKDRARQDEETNNKARSLLGLETLHAEWKQWKHDAEHPLKMEGRGGGYDSLIKEREKHSTDYFDDLNRLGFKSNQEFEDAMEVYRTAFRDQTVRFALDQLTLYEHMLFTEKQKLEKRGGAKEIATGIAGTDAAKHFKNASLMASYGMIDPGIDAPKQKGMELQPSPVTREREEGKKEVIEGSKDQFVAQHDIDQQKLSGLDEAGIQQYLLGEIADRYEKLKQTRAEFAEDPNRIYTLPKLLEASREHQDIGKDTIYWMVVQDEVESTSLKKVFSDIAIGIIAIALTLLVPGGGAVAAAAMVANAGISVYQAYEAYEDYKKASNDYSLGFLDDKPSFGWVVLAVAAAAIDVGLPVAEVFAKSASGLSKLEAPLRAFDADKDATKLAAKMKEIEGLRPEVERALEARAQAIADESKAWKEAKASGPMLLSVPSLSMALLGVVQKYGKPLYYTIRRGIKSFTALAKDAEFLAAMGDITKMTGADREAIETAFAEMKQVVDAGEKARMDEKTLEKFADRWIAGRGAGGNFHEKFLDEMKVWKPLTEEQKNVASRLGAQKSLVEGRYLDKADALEERAGLIAQPSRTKEEVARIRELEQELNRLDPLWQQATLGEEELAKLRAQRLKQGKGLGQIHADEVALEGIEQEAKAANLSLYDRLRAAAPSEEAKERALKGITVDQVGPLKTKPSSLQVDHIVPVDEIADMEGFKDLTWKDQKRIVDMKENLVVMDGSANASKSNRTWRSWPQWSTYYDELTKTKMIGAEDKARAAIQAEIERLKSIPVNP